MLTLIYYQVVWKSMAQGRESPNRAVFQVLWFKSKEWHNLYAHSQVDEHIYKTIIDQRAFGMNHSQILWVFPYG